MRVYLHIGVEKTGTSAIQRFLRTNRTCLSSHGWLFPRSPGEGNHIGLAAAAQRTEKRDDLRHLLHLGTTEDVIGYRRWLTGALSEEIRNSTASACILSSEHCSSRLVEEDEVASLYNMLHSMFDDVRVVVYLRRQDEMWVSSYSTDLKTGSTKPLEFPSDDLIRDRYDFERLLGRWAKIFGTEALVCRRYMKDALRNKDAIDDFCDAIGDPPLCERPMMKRPHRINESLDAETAELLRLLNHHIPRFDLNGINPLRGQIELILSEIGRGAPICPKHDDRLRLMASLRDVNGAVADAYFGGRLPPPSDPLFGPFEPHRGDATSPLTLHRAVALFAALWSKKQERVLKLEDKITQLKERNARLKDR